MKGQKRAYKNFLIHGLLKADIDGHVDLAKFHAKVDSAKFHIKALI